MKYIVYTYKTVDGKLVCHAYGPSDGELFDDEQTATNAAIAVAQNDDVQYMVLPVEGLPTI